MANPIIVSMAIVFGAATGIVLMLLFVPPEQIVSFLVEYGNVLLLIAQVAGIFYAGMTTNIKLGAILIITVLATIIWGW